MVWPSTSHTDRTGSRTSSGGCGSGRGTCSRCSARSSAGETVNDASFRAAFEVLWRGVPGAHGGGPESLLDPPTHAARAALKDLPGVGPKTADVWLSLVAGRDTMPVDTHIARLARRWRLARTGNYEEITAQLKALIPPSRRARGHLVLIQFGREVCAARRPRCEVCPVYDLCDANVKRPRSA